MASWMSVCQCGCSRQHSGGLHRRSAVRGHYQINLIAVFFDGARCVALLERRRCRGDEWIGDWDAGAARLRSLCGFEGCGAGACTIAGSGPFSTWHQGQCCCSWRDQDPDLGQGRQADRRGSGRVGKEGRVADSAGTLGRGRGDWQSGAVPGFRGCFLRSGHRAVCGWWDDRYPVWRTCVSQLTTHRSLGRDRQCNPSPSTAYVTIGGEGYALSQADFEKQLTRVYSADRSLRLLDRLRFAVRAAGDPLQGLYSDSR